MCLKGVAASAIKSLKNFLLDCRIIINMEFLSFGESFISPIISVFEIVLMGKAGKSHQQGNRKFCWENFFIEWWESDKEWFWTFEPFSKLKTRFCEYWTSIKIKISMTCMYKDYKFKIKMVQEQWLQLKMKSLWGSNMKIVI